MEENLSREVSMTIPRELRNELKIHAKEDGRTMVGLIRYLLKKEKRLSDD